MRSFAAIVTLLVLGGCAGKWTAVDDDGDGYTLADGDCSDGPDGADIHPDADETFYDGVDQDCSGGNDFDQDGDGHASVDYPDPTGELPSDDCWDDPAAAPGTVVTMDTALTAADVYPGATETWYDGVDQDCGGEDDFDQDGDGHTSQWQDGPDGAGDDCLDATDDPWENGGGLDPAAVNPDATETWYDGTDADCAGDNDFDQDKDGWVRDEECDDTDPERYPDPDKPEVWYDGLDDNCDGNDGDQDGDGYYVEGYEFEIPSAYQAGDCNDDPLDVWDAIDPFPDPAASDVNPGAAEIWYDGLDEDCAEDDDFDQDLDGHRTDAYVDGSGDIAGDDCDDVLADVYPGADEEWYDGLDADCAGDDDYDQDADGYADASGGGNDCADTDATIHPGASEICDSVDGDCDGSTNDPDSSGCTDFYADADGDSYGADADFACLCEAEGDYASTSAGDCDDGNAAISPSAVETCTTDDDDDCDGDSVGVNATACDDWYVDLDADGYGGDTTQCACIADGLYTATSADDCDDADESSYPSATEVCDGADNDCDSTIDEGVGDWYPDDDGDGDGDAAGTPGCEASGLVQNSDDCDDTRATVYTGADEICDGVANDCATESTWTSADEDLMVSSVDSSGNWTDISSSFSGSSTYTLDLTSGYAYYFCAGTYDAKIRAISDTATVEGIYGPDVTVLDVSATSGSTVSVTSGSVTISGFTISGGHGSGTGTTYGGGIFATATTTLTAPNLTVEDCIVTGNTASNGGGVSSWNYAWVELVDTVVEDNTATNGGGVHTYTYADLTLDGVTIQNNAASGDGGGLYLDDGTLDATDSYLLTNEAADDAGGMFIDTGTAAWTNGGIYGNTFSGGSSHGGGVYLSNYSTTAASFTAVNVDFGSGADDNTTSDVALKSGTSTYVDYTGYEAGETFTCLSSTDVCTPTP